MMANRRTDMKRVNNFFYGLRGEIKKIEREPRIEFGKNALRRITVAFGSDTAATVYTTEHMLLSTLWSLLSQSTEVDAKDWVMIHPGRLASERSRKQRKHVKELFFAVYDYDKGDVDSVALSHRLRMLGFEAFVYPSYNHGKTQTSIAWGDLAPNSRTGQLTSRPTPLVKFTRQQLDREDVEPNDITADIARQFLIEVQGFDATALGEVRIQSYDSERVIVQHGPIPKTRAFVLLQIPFARGEDETDHDFQERWAREVYHPVGNLIGFRFDSSCDTVERAHHGMTRREGTDHIPGVHVEGDGVDWTDQRITDRRCQKPQSYKKRHKHRKSPPGKSPELADRWMGFKAADAAADHVSNAVDKRSTKELVEMPCPFVNEHATTNDPRARQCYAYNADGPGRLPVVKCQSDTCKGRPASEFLSRLFGGPVEADPRYRSKFQLPIAGGFTVHEDTIEPALYAMNDLYAVVPVGGKARYLNMSTYQLLDRTNLRALYEGCVFEYLTKDNQPRTKSFIDIWLNWPKRRQYAGYGFYPAPVGHPDACPPGFYNTFHGFSVEPRKGSWKRLLRHLYTNVCQADRDHFRFLIAFLAQLVQHPHVKPGTAIVLRGPEGTGKSKLGEWLLRLLGPHGMVAADASRITGRFNVALSNKILVVLEEAFWAGDKAAEGTLKESLNSPSPVAHWCH